MSAASLDSALSAMMNTTVIVYQGVTRDAYGKQTLGTGTSVLAHISRGSMKLSDGETQDVPAVGKVYLAEILNIDPATDELELPDGSRPKIVEAIVRYDEFGQEHHEEVSLTRERV